MEIYKKVSVLSFTIGSIVDIVGTNLWGGLMTIYVMMSYNLFLTPASSSTELTAKISNILQTDPLILSTNFIVGAMFSILGGYIAALIAKHDEPLNGALSSILGLLSRIYRLLTGSHPIYWILLEILTLILSPLFGMFGGYLRLKQKSRKQMQAMAYIQNLIKKLQSGDVNERSAACKELRMLPSLPQEALEALHITTNDKNPGVVESAQQVLATHGETKSVLNSSEQTEKLNSRLAMIFAAIAGFVAFFLTVWIPAIYIDEQANVQYPGAGGGATLGAFFFRNATCVCFRAKPWSVGCFARPSLHQTIIVFELANRSDRRGARWVY